MLIDGIESATLPADDRGLAYGDGLFETMRFADGLVPLMDLHFARLAAGCARLGLPCPGRELIEQEIRRVAADRDEGVVKLTLTRGSGGRGYAPPTLVRPRRLVACYPLPDYPQESCRAGVRVAICATRLGRNPALAGLKHLGRLEQVLASAEERPPDCAEGLMLDVDDRIVEGIRSNLFVVRGGRVETPRLDASGVAGVMRAAVIEESPAIAGEVAETDLDIAALLAADEVFLTSSIFGIWPVNGLARPATDWPVGPVTRMLMTRIAKRGVAAWAG